MPPSVKTAISTYDRDAREFARAYESVSFEHVHSGILDLIPTHRLSVLDVGAGSGRDAAALASKGHLVTAVEPSQKMRLEAARLHPNIDIEWIDDQLPELFSFEERAAEFHLVLVSAVWMHLNPNQYVMAMQRLSRLMAPSGLLIISLRHGPADKSRKILPVSEQEVVQQALRCGLQLFRRSPATDALGRQEITWTTLVFRKDT